MNRFANPSRIYGLIAATLLATGSGFAFAKDVKVSLNGGELLQRSYRSALQNGYLWHEFGDSHLILR